MQAAMLPFFRGHLGLQEVVKRDDLNIEKIGHLDNIGQIAVTESIFENTRLGQNATS
jgi:hypothetical protein